MKLSMTIPGEPVDTGEVLKLQYGKNGHPGAGLPGVLQAECVKQSSPKGHRHVRPSRMMHAGMLVVARSRSPREDRNYFTYVCSMV